MFSCVKGEPRPGKRTISDDSRDKKGDATISDRHRDKASSSSEADAEGRDSGNKKTKVQSVLEYPPAHYNGNVFRANNPFVAVFEQSPDVKKVVEGDKIRDGKWMQKDALDLAIDMLVDSAARAAVSFKEPTTETGGRVIHGSLVLDLWFLTEPSAEPVNKMIGVAELEELEPVWTEDDADDIRGLVIEQHEDERSSTESIKSLDLRHEGDDPGDTNRDEKTRYDFQLLAHSSRVSLGLDDLVSLMFIECAWDTLSKKKLYQAAQYACEKGAIQNMKKGRYEPIFLEAWGESNWMYGILFVKGIVTIADGQIANIHSKENVEKRNLEKQLKASVDRMHKDYKKNSPAVYPDGEYVLGTLLVSRKKYLLPKLNTPGSGGLHDTRLFYQSLLRAAVGDKVLSWTKEDVQAAHKLRLDQIQAVKNRFRGVA